MNRRILEFVLITGLLTLTASPCFSKTETTTVNLMSAPFGTGSYVLSAALEDLAKKHHDWLRVSHSESPGLVFNIKKIDKEQDLKAKTIISSTIGVNWLAENGKAPFDRQYKGVKLIANYNLISVWLATLDKKLQKPSDFVGKQIALGRATQISWAIQPEMVIRSGWGIADKTNLQHIGTGPSVSALLDGLVDAIVIGGYLNPKTFEFSLSPQTNELIASGKEINHVSWGLDAIAKTKETGIPITEITIPVTAIDGLKKPIESFTDSVAWCVSSEFPEEIAYEVAKLIIQHCSDFSAYHNLGKLMTPDSLPFGWGKEQIHPGALKAYREAGIIE